MLALVTLLFEDVTSDKARDLIFAAALFGVLNTILKPILRALTLPFAVITLGLVWFGVSMLMLKITAVLVDGFAIKGFWTLVWATVVVWAVYVVLDFVRGPWRGNRRD